MTEIEQTQPQPLYKLMDQAIELIRDQKLTLISSRTVGTDSSGNVNQCCAVGAMSLERYAMARRLLWCRRRE